MSNFDWMKPQENQEYEERTQMIGATDFRVLAVNPEGEEYERFKAMGDFPLGKEEPEYFKEDKSGNNYLRIMFLVESEDKTCRDVISFMVYNELQKSKSGKLQYIDGLAGTGYADMLDDNTLDLNTYAHEHTAEPVYRGEADLLSFLLYLTGAKDINGKAQYGYNKAIKEYETASSLGEDVEGPEIPNFVTIDMIRPNRDKVDLLFDGKDTYKDVVSFYKDLVEKLNSHESPSMIKAARGLKMYNGKVYSEIYTRQFTSPGKGSPSYDPSSRILKDIEKNMEYLRSQNRDVPYYNVEDQLEWKEWDGDIEKAFSKNTNTSQMSMPSNPITPEGMPGMPPMPTIPNMGS